MVLNRDVQQMTQTDEAFAVPRHLAVTMDGNGRWATARGKPRTEGHREGVKALRRLIEYCIRYGVNHVTVFSFSSENWRRPRSEISFIFSLLQSFVESDLQDLVRNNVRVRIVGGRAQLEKSLIKTIDHAEAMTARCTGLELVVAFNYGGRDDIVSSARVLAQKAADGTLDPNNIDENMFADHLMTGGVPDPDILLRTGGEQRISNFLLWQAAYAEMIFVNELWPDFDEACFRRVLQAFSQRERRFGAVEARIA